MIYDTFQFFNELELLDIRLLELSDVVDYFVLVEATKTHTGLDKPLYYDENKHLFSEFSSRILHIIVQDMPTTKEEVEASLSSQDRHWLESGYQLGSDWVRERFQRNAIMRGLEHCDPDDIIVISDADEIVRASVLRDFNNTIVDGSNAVELTLNTYYINWQCTNMPRGHRGTSAGGPDGGGGSDDLEVPRQFPVRDVLAELSAPPIRASLRSVRRRRRRTSRGPSWRP